VPLLPKLSASRDPASIQAETLQTVIESALARIHSSIKVGGQEISISGVGIEQKLMISGSLKASLEEICEFVAEGELTVSAHYGKT
jgi:hypothetical protein